MTTDARRVILLATLSVFPYFGLPLAGAIGGMWVGKMTASDPGTDSAHPPQCGLSAIVPIFGGFFVGGVLGLGAAAACMIGLGAWALYVRPAVDKPDE